MSKLRQPTPEERLEALRSQLEKAERAASAVPEDAAEDVKAAAEKRRAAAEKALAQAHLEEHKRQADAEREERSRQAALEALSLQERNQVASTQNVKGTHELTPEQHAKRRSPRHS